MLMYKKILPILALCSLVVGCQTTDINDNAQFVENNWKVTAERISHAETVYFGDNASELTEGNRTKIRHLFSAASIESPFYARLFVNKLCPPKNDEIIAAQLREIKSYLRCLGVANHRIETIYLSPIAAMKHCNAKAMTSGVGINIDQYRLILPQCPEWDQKRDYYKDPNPDDNNFGCTTARNLAFSVAEPKDFYEGETLDNADGAHNAIIVNDYKMKKDAKAVVLMTSGK